MGAAAFNESGYVAGACNSTDAHAEVALLWMIRGYRGTPLTVYIYRQNAKGVPAISRPCKNCMRALLASRIVKQVVYFDADGNMRTERLL